MEKFYYTTLPNFTGLKIDLYFSIFFTLLALGLSVGIFIYLIIKYRRRKKLEKMLIEIEKQTNEMDKSSFKEKILKSNQKEQTILFVEYLYKFHTTQSSANFEELFLSVGIEPQEAKKISIYLYKGAYSPHIKTIIHDFLHR